MVKRYVVTRRLVSLAVGSLLVAACGSGSSTSDSVPAGSPDTTGVAPTTTLPYETQPLEWKSCDGVECAEIEVPFDYFTQPTGTFTLQLSRQRALKSSERIGVLLVNPGGPGAPGRSLAQNAAYYFSRDIIDRFDIVAWDPRGTGASTPAVDCIDDHDEYFAQPLSAESGQKFVDACTARSGAILPHVGTANSARDIEAIRRALGETTISYFGFSYGGLLGLVWKSMFPETVRAVVLDAPPSPIASRAERIASQASGFEKLLNEFLKKQESLTAWEAATTAPPEGITKHMVLAAAISALYDETAWTELDEAITAAADGDGSKIRAMYEGYFYQDEGFEDYRNTFEASIAVSCVDDTQNVPLGDLATIAPRLQEFFSPDELCSRWPARSDETYFFRGSTDNPTIIIGAIDDPASPYVGVQAAASVAGNVRLVTVDERRHTSYLVVDCVTKLVDDYLIDLADVPNTTCTTSDAITAS
jgi:pimeloyl-ACP methyl ester carboxylesterase